MRRILERHRAGTLGVSSNAAGSGRARVFPFMRDGAASTAHEPGRPSRRRIMRQMRPEEEDESANILFQYGEERQSPDRQSPLCAPAEDLPITNNLDACGSG